MAEPKWRRTGGGSGPAGATTQYRDERGNVLAKVGRRWVLTARGGRRYDLGTKASTPARGTKTLQARAVKVARKVGRRSTYQRGTAYQFTVRGGARGVGGRQG
jgi:hypothetical protein